jgi:hypothetical protein
MQSNNNIIKRELMSKPVSELIDKDVFEPYKPQKQKNCGQTSDKEYRIPEHQRFYKWDEEMQRRLVESVMWDLPLDALMFSKHKDDQNDDYYMIQNGQQRMTTLHNFREGKCDPSVQYEGKSYAQFTENERASFNNYQVPCQFISKKSGRVSDEAYNTTLTCIFERLNSGKPLTDCEKYHARRNSPVVNFATKEIIEDPELNVGFDTFVGPIGTGKTFKQMGDMVGAVLSIANGTGQYITTSFMNNCVKINDELTEETKENVKNVLKHWFRLLNLTFTNTNAVPTELRRLRNVKKQYGKLSGPFGLFIVNKILQTKGEVDLDDQCWVWAIQNWSTSEFNNEAFSSLSAGDRRNLGLLGDAGLKRKLQALIDCFDIKQQISNSDLHEEDNINVSEDNESIMSEMLFPSDDEDDSDN